jgi:hypothetical protein
MPDDGRLVAAQLPPDGRGSYPQVPTVYKNKKGETVGRFGHFPFCGNGFSLTDPYPTGMD